MKISRNPSARPGQPVITVERKKCQKEKATAQWAAKLGDSQGNWNALKHGYYSKRFNPLELKDLDTVLTDGLQDEIALLRVIIRRVFLRLCQ